MYNIVKFTFFLLLLLLTQDLFGTDFAILFGIAMGTTVITDTNENS